MISSFIVSTLKLQISLNKSVKNTYLIYDYSIKSKTKTKEILQKLAFDNNYRSKLFPSHRKQASDYFEKQRARMIKLFKEKLNAKRNTMNMAIDDEIDHDTEMEIDQKTEEKNNQIAQ